MGKKKLEKRLKRAMHMAETAKGAMGGQGLAGMGGREQFIIGALIGAGAAYVLGDEKLRARLIRAGLRLYSGLASGFEEMKEQMADVRAEMAAEENAGA